MVYLALFLICAILFVLFNTVADILSSVICPAYEEEKSMKRKPQIIIGIILIVIFVLLVVAAPLLAPNDPNATDLALKNAPPSAEYPLGCDQMGRCELSRLIYGARYSLGLSIPVLIILASCHYLSGVIQAIKAELLTKLCG